MHQQSFLILPPYAQNRVKGLPHPIAFHSAAHCAGANDVPTCTRVDIAGAFTNSGLSLAGTMEICMATPECQVLSTKHYVYKLLTNQNPMLKPVGLVDLNH